MDDHFEATTAILKDVVERVTYTNGSVNDLKQWRQYIMGGLTVLMVIIIPVLGYLSYEVIQDANAIAALQAIK